MVIVRDSRIDASGATGGCTVVLAAVGDLTLENTEVLATGGAGDAPPSEPESAGTAAGEDDPAATAAAEEESASEAGSDGSETASETTTDGSSETSG